MARQKKLPPGLWKRGDTYYARFTAGGRLVRKKLSTDYKAAVELLNELKARADKADFGLTDNDYKWDDLKAEFLRWAKQAVRNSSVYEADLKMIEGYSRVRSVRQIDHAFVFGFREWRQSQTAWGRKGGRRVTPRTINRQVGTLRNMLSKGVAWGKIGSNPIADVKPLRHDSPTKQRRSLTVEEVASLFAASPPNLQAIWRTFMTTGIRRAELVNLRFADVDFERKVATVRAQIAKNHKAREIPLDDDTLATIRALRAAAPARQATKDTPEGKLSREHVFVTSAGTPWRNNLLRVFYTYCRKAGIDGAERCGSVDIHSLRVSFTTLALENGASPKAVQAILGHSTLSLTMGVYAKATESAKREAVAALPFATITAPAHVIPMQKRTGERTASNSTAQSESRQPVAQVS